MKAIEEQSILVTGATDGIGRGAATELARRGATVLLHGRDAARVAATRDAISAESGSERLESYVADFAALADVRRLAEEVGARHERLDVLLNNAGIGRGPRGRQTREESADGYELRFQVNYLAPFLLQLLLLPLLRAAVPARIVNVASVGQAPIDFDDVMLERGYDSMHAYCQSKLALVMASFELAGRLDPDEVTVNALHPGTLLDTKMVREGFGAPMGPVETGVEAEVYLATSPELEGVTGEYFDRTKRARADAQAYDTRARRKLWQLSERWVGLAG
ncbi:MAG: SDR family NAD(P)-dependent oxidoreductase [Gammaproteobacteria bacterium]|nr:SDR family NAD(P)-dependent oxidoreductase [Gammaproteobacteria bacterium]NIR88841.1 SDR family NAD(P)-dependent oxidoreductase [Gammaproteobacteria bacterium]NIU06445.1 SDR family NAD(P)-dependent oxidoreductase [Gammaproteobacteria bacterium]NIV53337.1 SDR family NAD(P)-dependent oxidoreductase [Gammaproteobacteria bacterium]NIV74056.1 SDR family NAD(P)-dependent oxidoreductase [Gammaproteobacteria bacterium]